MKTLGASIGGNSRITGGPFGSKLTTRDYTWTGVPVIRGSNMEANGRWIGGDFAFVSESKVEKDLRSNLAFAGDIVVTQRGTLGQVSVVPEDGFQRYVVSQSQMAISVDSEYACRDFVYYYLRSPKFAEYSHTKTIQTGVPHINLGILRDAPAPFPSLIEQREIAAVLGALDDKTEFNCRMSTTLEEMARALFRSWFVDFDPVHAKARGKAPAHMDAAIAALFPDSFGPEGIPTGWRRMPLRDAATILSGGTPSKHNGAFWDGDLPWISPKIMTGVHVLDSEDRVTRAAVGSGTRLAPAGSVLVMVRGMGLHQGVRISQARREVTFNQDVKALVPTSVPASMLLFGLLDAAPSLFSKVESSGHGTGKLPSDKLKEVALNLPGAQELAPLMSLLDPINDRIAACEIENGQLATLRDALLPKLMSGELRVRDAERRLAEAV